MVATTGALAPQRSAFRLLLSHKRNVVEFVGAGSNRSHAAWTEFMPVRVAKRRHHQERRALIPVYAKRRVLLELVFSIKSGDDLLSHKCLQYHRPKIEEED